MASVPSVASFVGAIKEVTPGTPLAATTFFPGTTFTPQDVKNYVPDTGIRGSFVDSYDQIPTQGWSTYSLEGPLYVDSFGLLLKSLMGEEAAASTGPTTHTFTLLNSGAQPPTLTVTDYNGVQARQFAFSIVNSITINFGPDQLISYSAQCMGLLSATASTPTKSYTAVAAKPGHLGTVTIGSSTSLLQSGSITISRNVGPILTINNSATPTEIFAGALSATGNLTTVYQADALVVTPHLAGTVTALDLTWTSGATTTAYGLNIHATSGLFTNNTIDRGSDYVKMNTDFYCKPNTTDVGASSGYSPLKVVLTNQTPAAY